MLKKCMVMAATFILIASTHLNAETGNDLLRVFKRAHQGKPLTCVALGGSITQAGKGWVASMLRKSFPRSIVTMHNAGMSATGSMLGMFRLDRDVISCQPDLVLIEYAVNDGSGKDEDVYWTLESIVRRLKSLDNPPAIVFLMAASKQQSKIYRHMKVAQHYNLLSVNLQTKSDDYLKKNKLKWETLFGDSVHPNKKGHEFYAKAIFDDLKPYIEKSVNYTPSSPAPMPKQLSKRKLILDGRMVPIAVAPGWTKQSSLPSWWDRFFMGVTCAKQPGTTMQIPFRGTVAGLYYALSKKYGEFYANVDGHGMQEMVCNMRGGYKYSIVGQELSPEVHILNIALPEGSTQGEGVKLGFLLLGGETGAKNTIAPQGENTPDKMKKAGFRNVSTEWLWSGPFGNTKTPAKDNKDLNVLYPPEKENKDFKNWKKCTGTLIDFADLSGYKDRGVNYAKTTFNSDKAETRLFALRVDYWAKIWLNGKLVVSVTENHGAPYQPIFFKADLKKGRNEILVKVQSGSLGNKFSLKIGK